MTPPTDHVTSHQSDIKCSDPPGEPNAAQSGNASHITYTCRENFLSCGPERVTSTCQDNGKWSPVKLHCQRFRWTNFKPETLRLPRCRGIKDYNITFKGIPNDPDVFNIRLISGKDILLHLTIQFRETHGHDMVHWAYLLSHIPTSTDFGTTTVFPFRINKLFEMLIHYSFGEFNVRVDGKELLTIKQGTVIRIPKTFKCYDNITPRYCDIRYH